MASTAMCGAALVVGGAGLVGALVSGARPADAQSTTTIDLAPFDKPFSRGYYLIHLLGTNTMDGFVEKDAYILWATQPENGWFLTPDGMGGTFNNKGTSIGGPFTTPRQVCAAAKGLPATKQSFSVEERYWDCRQLSTAGGDGGGGGGIGTAGLVGALAAGAAAAAGLALTWNRIRNRPRPDWARTDPGDGLSPECFHALTDLRSKVDDVLGKLSDLQLARDGAARQAVAANAQAELLDAFGSRPGTAAGEAGEAAGTTGTVTDVAGVVGSVIEGSDTVGVPGWVAAARKTLAESDDLVAAVRSVRQLLAEDLMRSGSSLIDTKTLAAYSREAAAGWSKGASAAATAASRAQVLEKLGFGLGVINALASAASWVLSERNFDDLDQMGRWRGEAELARAEADRWMGLAGEIADRTKDLQKDFDAAIAAYNERARVCNAVPLTPPAWSNIVEEFGEPALPIGQDAPPSTALQTLLPPGPEPVPSDDRTHGCDRSVYDRLLADFRKTVELRDAAAARHRRWAQHTVDAQLAVTAIDADRERLRAYLEECQSWWRGLNTAGLIATSVPLVAVVAPFVFTLSPAGAIICGFTSITASFVGSAAVPENLLIEAGKLDAIAEQLPTFVAQFRLERDRARQEVEDAEENARQRHFQLTMMHGRCSAATGAGWPEPPPCTSLTIPIITTGSPHPYVEIIRWH